MPNRLARRKKQFARSWRARDDKSHARFSRRMKNQNTAWFRRPAVEMGFLVVLLVVWAGLLLYHPFFLIGNVKVEVTNGDNAAEYRSWVEERLSTNHMLSLNSSYFATQVEDIQANIRNDFPVQSLEIRKEFPGRLHIIVTEQRDEVLVYGHDGVLAKAFTNNAVEPITQDKTPAVQKEIDVEIPIPVEEREEGGEETKIEKERVFDHAGTFVAVQRIHGEFPVIFADLPEENIGDFVSKFLHFTTQVESFSSAGEVGEDWFFVQPSDSVYHFELHGVSGWKIIFDKRYDFFTQLDKVHHVLLTNDLSTLEKIDVRYGEKIFITRKK